MNRIDRSTHASPASEPSEPDLPRRIGREIRDLRKARGVTLAAIAEASGLSIGYLSLVERDLATPSIKALHAVSRALGVTIGWFFETGDAPEAERDLVVRRARRRRLEYSAGMLDELLSPNLSGALELLSCRLSPGASSGAEPYAHAGEEAGLVIRGRLELWVDGRKAILEAGDSFGFQSALPHRYCNPGPDETEVIWAITPPSYLKGLAASLPPIRGRSMHRHCRRSFLAGLAAVAAFSRARAASSGERLDLANKHLASIEAREGGRLGVFVRDTGTGATLERRADERFPMCSTFKLLASAAVLKRVDQGAERLDRTIAYGPSDLLEYAPIAKTHVAQGGMTLAEACAAAIDWSDNTAANLILQAIGGPAGFTQFARSLGDNVTRLDRNEPSLNTAIPGDERDTTSPRAMAEDMRRVLIGDALSEASRRQLTAWLIDDKVGDKRLRAGLPPSWRIGDKTGSGDRGTTNTIAIIWPPERAPIIAAVYYTGSSAPMDARNAVHKEIGGLIAETF